MKNLFIVFLLVLLCGCHVIPQSQTTGDRYYAPTNYIPGLEWETMLTTQFATFDITPHGELSDISFSFKGKDGGPFSIDEFRIDITDVPCDKKGRVYLLMGDAIPGVVSYSMVTDYHGGKRAGSVNRNFNISGSVDKKNPSGSTVTFTSKIFEKNISLSVQNLTSKQSEAEFGQQGYPGFEVDGKISATHFFINNTGHNVTVQYALPNDIPGLRHSINIKAGESGNMVLLDEEEYPNASFILIFDDGRQSRHIAGENRFEYSGLPSEIIEHPFLFFNYGIIYYDRNYDCTYTITQELYDNASLPE